MFTRMVGSIMGSKIAKQTKTMGGTTGAMVGAAIPFVLSRMSIPAMIAMGIGGYAVKKYLDKNTKAEPSGANDTGSIASIPQPETA